MTKLPKLVPCKPFKIVGAIDETVLQRFYKFVGKLEPDSTAVIQLSSGGGDPDVALAIIGLMRSRPDVTWVTEAYGYIYSAAVLIFCAGSTRRFSDYAWAMVHEGSDRVKGNASTIKNFAKSFERCEEHWNSLMEKFTGTPASQWAKLSERDTYFNAAEAIKLGIATEVI